MWVTVAWDLDCSGNGDPGVQFDRLASVRVQESRDAQKQDAWRMRASLYVRAAGVPMVNKCLEVSGGIRVRQVKGNGPLCVVLSSGLGALNLTNNARFPLALKNLGSSSS